MNGTGSVSVNAQEPYSAVPLPLPIKDPKTVKKVYASLNEVTQRCYFARYGRVACFCVVILLVARDMWSSKPKAQARLKFDEASFHSECMHPMGGGLIQAGGSFKPLNDSVLSKECASELQMYFNQEEGQYWVDVARVAEAARQHFDDVATSEPPTPRRVIVFDIDETTLSNSVEFQQRYQQQQQQQQQDLGRQSSRRHLAGTAAAAATASGAAGERDAAPAAGVRFGKSLVGATDRPPLAAMLALYQYLYASGYSVAFITGRKESDRNGTMLNLRNAGYGTLCKKHDAGHKDQHLSTDMAGTGAAGDRLSADEAVAQRRVTSSACFVALHLRDMDDNRFASVYKPERRAALAKDGFTIYGNFGDQFSDLDGTSGAAHSFKLPNPGYLIL